MASRFSSARDEILAAMVRNFAEPMTVQRPDAMSQSIQGYVKTAELNGHTLKRLLTDAQIPTGSSIAVDGERYVLTFNGPQESKGNRDRGSQLIREYVLMPERTTDVQRWSEWGDK